MPSQQKRALLAASAAIIAVLPMAIWLWAFMVDDALISARYAANIASGAGYRFNPGGAITDGVTPLGWAPLLATFARSGTMAAFVAAKWLGLLSWLAGAAVLGLAIHRLDGAPLKWLALTLIATSAPLGAWSVAGMETGVVLGLACGAVGARVLQRERLAMACAALVAWWRPETLPWAMVLALSPTPVPVEWSRRWAKLGVVTAPALAAMLLRLVVFGHAMPLGAIAKPSTIGHGAAYALACAILCGAIAMVPLRRQPRWVVGLIAAVVAHFLSLVVVGGDWMPLSRLAVPVLPTLAIAAAAILSRAHAVVGCLRILLALAGQLFVVITVAPRAAAVGPSRISVIEQLHGPLAEARVAAALDIGWLGAATDASIVDLAGVTDPAIAVLPGGHTTKHVSHTLLQTRQVDTLVLLLAKGHEVAQPWTRSHFARGVEYRIAAMPAMAEDFEPVAVSEGKLRYLVLRRRGSPE